MTDKEKLEAIKAEIERLKESGCASPIVICDTLLAFIDSLQKEPVKIKKGCKYLCLVDMFNNDTGKISFIGGKIYLAPKDNTLVSEENGWLCDTSENSSNFELVEEPVSEDFEAECNHCQGFNDKEKCDELVFGRKCPLQKGDNSELTEFEKAIKGLLFDAGDKYDLNTDLDKATKDLAPHFLEAARKQFVEEACNWLYDMWPQIAESPQFIEDFRKALEKGVKDDIK